MARGRCWAAALQAEVAAYIGQFADVRDENGRRLVVRNGTAESRAVVTSAGAVEVTAPQVNDKRTDPATGERMRFSSAILPPWARKTPQVSEVRLHVGSGAAHSPHRWLSDVLWLAKRLPSYGPLLCE
jgi:hypothetical protein